MKIFRNLTAMAVAAAALTIAAEARADSISFFLNQGECTGTCGAGTAPALISNSSAVEVVVTTTLGTIGDFTKATVEFIAPGTTTIDTPVFINVNGTYNTTYSASVVGNNNSVGGVTGSGSEDHFGTMTNGTGAVGGNNTITFTLTELGTNFWTSAASVLVATTGFGAAYGHGFEAVEGGNQFAGYYSATPLPATISLFTGGLGVFGFLARRKKRNAQALAAA